MKNYYTNIMRLNIFVVINQTNKHKPKIYNQCTYSPKLFFKKFFFFTEYKNEWKFDDKKIKKSDFYNNKNKKIFNIDDIDVNKILVSKKEQYGKHNSFKYFIGYNYNDVMRPLFLGLSQMTDYINNFDENKNKNTITMSFKVKDQQLLKNYNKYGKKLKN